MSSGRHPVTVIAALPEEVEAIARSLKRSRRRSPRVRLWEGDVEGAPVALVLGGVGKVAGALAAQFACDRLEPSAIVSIGLAGGIESRSAPGHVIVADGAVQYDYDARPLAHAKGVLPGLGLAVFAADTHVSEKLAAASRLAVDDPSLVRSGLVLTGDQIITSGATRDGILADFPAGACFDMETAAVAQVACANAVPWGGVRITSDSADENFNLREVLGYGTRTAAELFERIMRGFVRGNGR